MVTYVTDKDKLELAMLTRFVESVDKDFTPPLAGRVEIGAWMNKIWKQGSAVVAADDDTYVGVIFFYANDMLGKKGYIAYLAVEPGYRGQGIAKAMLDKCLCLSRAAGMHSVEVYTNNPAARALYENMGFGAVSYTANEEYDLVQTFLIKQL